MRDSMTTEHLEKLRRDGEAGDAQAAYEVAEYHYGRREFELAFAWYLRTAQCDNPNPAVYFNLGYACQTGEGTEVDMVAAFDYYEKAADKGLPQALYNLAYFYQNGLVVRQDFARAAEYSRQAARELSRLVSKLYEAEAVKEKLMQEHLDMLRGLQAIHSEWKMVAEENARTREQLAAERVRKNAWKMRALKYEKKAERLEAENRSMTDLLIKAQYELKRRPLNGPEVSR